MKAPVPRLLRILLTWLAKGVAAFAALAIALVAGLLLVMWWEHQTRITLPTPSGPFAVGRTSYAWTNESEADDLALSPGSKKELLVWVWYPAAPSPKNVPAEYLPSLWRAAVAKQEGMLMRSFFKHDPALVQTHSVSGAALSSEQRSFSIRKPILNSGSCPIQRIGRGCWIAMRAG